MLKAIQSLSMFLLLLLIGNSVIAMDMDDFESQSLVHTAQVWALAKYRHPQVTNCQTDWDQVLLDSLSAVRAANSIDERSQVLMLMLERAGSIVPVNELADAPDWIAQGAFSEALKRVLTAVAAISPSTQCYVSRGTVGEANFDSDDGLNDNPAFPNESQRLLALFRLWGTIEYFFPYQSLIGRDWSTVLKEALPDILNANSHQQFHQALAQFHVQINDGHSYYTSSVYPLQTEPRLPLYAKSVDGKTIVVKTLGSAGAIRPGDEITAINGVPIAELKQRRAADKHGSNPVSQDYWLHRLLLSRSVNDRVTIEFTRLDGSAGQSAVISAPANENSLFQATGPVWRIESPDNACRIGVVDMARLQVNQLDDMMTSLASTDAMVFDLRNYPNGTIWGLLDRLFPQPRPVASFDQPDFNNPGSFERVNIALGGRLPSGYTGRVMMLVNEITLSQAEYSAMLLQGYGDTVTIGSQTQGADGNITAVPLPLSSQAFFSGLGVFYPDGRATQRIGIVPDIHVTPNRDDLIAGRDVVLETALDCGLLTAPTPARSVPPGMFFNTRRPGTGIDMHLAQGRMIALRYAFDENGEPEWILGFGERDQATSDVGLKRFITGAAPDDVASIRLDFHRGPYDVTCAIADQQSIIHSVRIEQVTPDGSTVSCLRPLVAAAGAGNGINLSGAWYAGEQDRGWALSVQQNSNRLTIIAYFNDTQGHPRWLAGIAEYSGQTEVTVDMLQINGYCDTCEPEPRSRQPAGQIRLHGINRQDSSRFMRLTMDFEYVGSAPIRWQRENVIVQRLTQALQ